MTTPDTADLPELPKAHGEVMIYDFNAKPSDLVRYRDVFTADQMREYAIAAVRAAQSAQPERNLLSSSDIETLAHRMASTYTHRTDPTSHAYGFVSHTLIDFVRAIERLHGIGEPK